MGLDFMTREIRNAGYNPSGAPACPGIAVAENQKIQVVSNANENLICGGVETAEIVTYAYDSSDAQITRNGMPLVENVPSTGFSFDYFRSDGSTIPMSGSPPAVGSGDLSSIWGIAIVISSEVNHPNIPESVARSPLQWSEYYVQLKIGW